MPISINLVQDAASASDTSWEAGDPAWRLVGLGLDFRVLVGKTCELRWRCPFDVNIEEGMDVVSGDGEASTRF